MTRIGLICVGLAILALGIDGGRISRSPQFNGASAQASAQAGGFGGPPLPPPAQFGPGFGGGNFIRPQRFGGGPGRGYGGGFGLGSGGGGGTISISKSISISRGGTAQSSAGSSASGK